MPNEKRSLVFLRQRQLGQVQRVASPRNDPLSASQSPRRDSPDEGAELQIGSRLSSVGSLGNAVHRQRIRVFADCRIGCRSLGIWSSISPSFISRIPNHMTDKAQLPVLSKDAISIGSFAEAASSATDVVVIIDVFRAFTTAAYVLRNGAEKIVMVDDLDRAKELRAAGIGRYCIGERQGIKPPGFDFGNSPHEIEHVRFDGETVIQTTSNGTRGIVAAKKASRLYAGSFANAEATVRAILSKPVHHVVLVAMGQNDVFRTEEDELCAFYLRSRLMGYEPDTKALRTLIPSMSACQDSTVLSEEDVMHCLYTDTVSNAISVTLKDGLLHATVA